MVLLDGRDFETLDFPFEFHETGNGGVIQTILVLETVSQVPNWSLSSISSIPLVQIKSILIIINHLVSVFINMENSERRLKVLVGSQRRANVVDLHHLVLVVVLTMQDEMVIVSVG